MKIIIVGFKVAEENSTYYRKIGNIDKSVLIQVLGKAMVSALDKSDFISVRITRNEKSIK